ncbi:hypothetical protein [Haloechinothrix salitolerans]|uniref:hypothetical protein n=1 Tax=Haloechinothrix salitolerans TaxID=926830 RepID=UPI0031E77935
MSKSDQERRGKLSGQIDQRGVTAQPRLDVQPVQPSHELPGTDRAAGCDSRQEPGQLHPAAHDSASATTADQVQHKRVPQRRGSTRGLLCCPGAEFDTPVSCPLGELGEGQGGDSGERLGVEQQEQAGDAIQVRALACAMQCS